MFYFYIILAIFSFSSFSSSSSPSSFCCGYFLLSIKYFDFYEFFIFEWILGKWIKTNWMKWLDVHFRNEQQQPPQLFFSLFLTPAIVFGDFIHPHNFHWNNSRFLFSSFVRFSFGFYFNFKFPFKTMAWTL